MIGLVLPTHTHNPAKLMASVEEANIPVRWYIFHHSHNRQLENILTEFSQKNDAQLYLYRENRGLARSWNEGIHQSVEDSCELTIVLNDDLHFTPGGFESFVKHLKCKKEFDLGFINGLEMGGAYDGQVIVQGMACFAIARACLDKIGYFDENFTPAYYEDMDYLHRMRLAGCSQTIAPNVIAEHHRSSTLNANPRLIETMGQWHERNRKYYEKKWGPIGQEIYASPFGNPKFDLNISWSNRDNPYGDEYISSKIV